MIFLRHIEDKHSIDQPEDLHEANNDDKVLHGKTILIADDDIRNAFALSVVLEEKGLQTLIAENGTAVLELLETESTLELVLMDIMMPEMDGYETIQKIRSHSAAFRDIPIIALTAKAMRGDRQKCIEAGANDYLSKPADIEKLISLLHVWLS